MSEAIVKDRSASADIDRPSLKDKLWQCRREPPRNRTTFTAESGWAVVHSGGHKPMPGFPEILVFQRFSRARGIGDGSPTLSASKSLILFS